MSTRTAIVIALLLAARPARAEDPLTVVVAGGPTLMTFEDTGSHLSLSLHLDLGFRIGDNVAIGAHASVSPPTSASEFVFLGSGPGPGSYFEQIEFTPLELAPAVTLTIPGTRVWLSPWIGAVDVQTTNNDAFLQRSRKWGIGCDVGYDLTSRDRQHFALFAGSTKVDQYAELTIGVAYRYW